MEEDWSFTTVSQSRRIWCGELRVVTEISDEAVDYLDCVMDEVLGGKHAGNGDGPPQKRARMESLHQGD